GRLAGGSRRWGGRRGALRIRWCRRGATEFLLAILCGLFASTERRAGCLISGGTRRCAVGGPWILLLRGGGGRLGIRVPVGARRDAWRVRRGFGRGGRCRRTVLLLLCGGGRGRGGDFAGRRALAIWFPDARGRRRPRARWRRCFPDALLVRRTRADGARRESAFRFRRRPCVLRWLRFAWLGVPGGCGCARLRGSVR